MTLLRFREDSVESSEDSFESSEDSVEESEYVVPQSTVSPSGQVKVPG